MPDRLARYREMRDFRRTPEPRGAARRAGARTLRFYIQRHHATRLHYDFRLELEGVLKSWAVPKGPSLDPSVRRLAVQTEDHPLEYGEFEGTIPENQYGAGEVLLWDEGEWIPQDEDPAAALRKGRLHFELRGEKLHGSWVLTRASSSRQGEEKRPSWLLIKRADDEARPGGEDIVLERPQSVKRPPAPEKRARRLKRPAKDTWIPEFVAPQLATLVTEPPRSGEWVYEIKHDGYRMLAAFAGGDVRLYTRTGNDWSAKLPHLVAQLRKMKLKESLLDGEIVVPGPDGRSDFQALQNAFDRGADAKIVYFVFDAPYLDGRDLRRLPLKERKARLTRAMEKAASSPAVRLSEHLSGSAEEVLAKACELGLEGLIGKEAGSVYASGRTRSWIKLKCRRRQDFVIGGCSPPKGSRSGFGALLVGYYDEAGKLQYAGKVGTGFDEHLLKTLTGRFATLKKPDSPFANPPKEKGVQWLRPKLVAEVAYAERTSEGILRQASFMGLREDLPAKAVREERAVSLQRKPTKITHPERLVWPALGLRKIDLVRYVEEVGEWLVPHVKDRPLTLVRCPEGAEAKCFYQRHLLMGASPGELKTVKREKKGGRSAYIYVSDLHGVLSAVQNGAVEFHTWGARVPDIHRPDRITMDLDPGPGVPWKTLVEATRMTKALIEGLGLKCFLKTTGGKGLHVVVPLQPELGWDEVKDFSHRMARFLVKANPALFTAKIAKAVRTGKVFVDYLRNSETASAVAAYSPRARPGAGVSVPLSWEELGAADLRERFTVKTVPGRLAALGADPWADYGSTRQRITDSMQRALGA